MLRRALFAFAAATLTTMSAAGTQVEKGQFDLFLNGVNKGYEKYKIETSPKKDLWTISSEIRFQLPMAKAKRGYIDLRLYPELNLRLQDRVFEGYYYRMTFDDYSNAEMVQAENSATEYVDQDLRYLNLENRSQQLTEDEITSHIDLGVNAGRVTVRGQTLSFKQTRLSNSRIKDEPLPEKPLVLDAYTFSLYIPLAQRALAMKSDREPLAIAFPQGMRLKPGTLQYMGIEKTPFHGEINILRHYDVNLEDGTLSSFWVDKADKLVQISIPSEGLLAVLAKYKPQSFDREEPRITSQTVASAVSFAETVVRIPSGDISLGATLTLPAEKSSYPTLLLIQDLQPLDRDGNDPANPYSRTGTWKQVAYLLAGEGYASLRYDARGVGESSGSMDRITWEERTQDLAALAAWLKQQPSTKGQRVIFAALGLGGWVAASAQPKAEASALLALAYPAKNLLRLWKEQANSGMDPEARLKAQNDLESLSAKLEEQGAEWASYGGQKLHLAEIRQMAALDPLSLASSLTIPCLFAYPERNQTVMAFHKDVLAPALHAGQEAVAIPGLGHRLTAYDQEGAQSGLVESKNLAPIFAWLKKVS
jgi:pimeloyl-ACP methyl ester carboxylesterase